MSNLSSGAKTQSHRRKKIRRKISGTVKYWYASEWRLSTFYTLEILPTLNFFCVDGFAFWLQGLKLNRPELNHSLLFSYLTNTSFHYMLLKFITKCLTMRGCIIYMECNQWWAHGALREKIPMTKRYVL